MLWVEAIFSTFYFDLLIAALFFRFNIFLTLKIFIKMNQSQINRTEMFEAVNAQLDAQAAIWSPVPVIGSYKLTLIAIIEGIKQLALEQEASQVFISQSIGQIKRQISAKLDILDDTLTAYAEDTDNPALLAKANNSESDYYRLTHEDFEIKAKNVLDLLDKHVPDMGDYGLTPEQIEDAKLSLNSFQEKRGKPRAYQVASRVATTGLDGLFKEATVLLGRLDKVMKRYKRSNPAFYNGYLAARTIIDN